jgi:hypothetical protein
MEETPDWARLLRHLGDAGASTAGDLKTELELKPKELKRILSPLERCGAIVSRAVEPKEDGMVQGFEYLRWDQIYSGPGGDDASLDDLVVVAVRAAVVARERELPKWFSWRWRFEGNLVERLVNEGRLERPASDWVAAPDPAS